MLLLLRALIVLPRPWNVPLCMLTATPVAPERTRKTLLSAMMPGVGPPSVAFTSTASLALAPLADTPQSTI